MTNVLKVYYGQSNGRKVFLGGEGATDDGEAFFLVGYSRVVSPAGSDGVAIFRSYLLTVVHTVETTLRVTPIIDGVAYDGTNGTTDERFPITLVAQEQRKVETFVVPLFRRLLDTVDPSTTVGRFYMRGSRFQVKVESLEALSEGDLFFDDGTLEFEPVLDTRVPAEA